MLAADVGEEEGAEALQPEAGWGEILRDSGSKWNPSLRGQYLPWESWMLPRLLPWSPFSRSSSQKLLHVEKESHSKREGQHSTLIPRLLLAGIIPIASALGADALGWDQQLFHSWESFNLCQS